MDSILYRKVFTYVWPCDSMRRAEIYFEWDAKKDRFVFERCDYSGVANGAYSRDDWEFLEKLSKEIMDLEQNETTSAFCARGKS